MNGASQREYEMKALQTRKYMNNRYDNIIMANNIDCLLTYSEAIAYSTRKEGWACDYYDINGVIISCGYASIGSRVAYKVQSKWDNKARKVINSGIEYEERKTQVNELLNGFIDEVV